MSVIEIRLRVRKASDRELEVVDVNRNLGFKIVRKGKSDEERYHFYIVRPNKVRKVVLSSLDKGVLSNVIKKVGSELKDDVLTNASEQLVSELLRLVDEWEEYSDVGELIEELGSGVEEPLFTIQSERGVIEVIKSDGLKIPLYGGYISLGSKYAVIETTYAYARVRKEVKSGIVEVEDVVPVMFISEFEGGKLISRKVSYPEKRVEVFGRPVRVEVRSKAKTVLTTLMDVETGKKFLDGGVSKQFNELFNMVRDVVKQYVNMDWDLRLYDFVSTFIIATYFYDMFTAFPRVHINGPYGSGKTRLGLVIAYSSRHGFVIVDPSEASVYRSIEAYGPTIYVDEAILNERLERLLSVGYKKGIQVPRVDKTSKEEFIINLFETYSPVIYGFTELPSERQLQEYLK